MIEFRTILVLLFISIATLSWAEIYRWVDENGQVHFGDKPGNTDHEVIKQNEEDFSTIGTPQTTDNKTDAAKQSDSNDEANPDDLQSKQSDDQSSASDSDGLSDEERARQKRIEEMEALAAELKAAREKRETKRDKEKEELAALREGCAKAEQRIEVLQKQIDHYITNQSNPRDHRRPDEIPLDTKRQRMAAELKSRQEFVEQNCDNL